jgi:hypothetical protein
MTQKADFSEEEWRTLGLAIICAAVAVSKAEHSGFAGESSERHITDEGRAQLARDLYADDEFIAALAETPETDIGAFILPGSDERRSEGLAYWREQALRACRDAVAILKAKGDAEDLHAYCRYVIDLGWRVTYAGRSAAVIGVGLGAASAEEVALMREIAAPGVDPNTAEPPASSSG